MRDYINRNEDELAECEREREQRNSWRKGEGKNKREMELEKQKVEDEAEYRAGFGKHNCLLCTKEAGLEVVVVPFVLTRAALSLVAPLAALPDLTLAENVFLCRQWINPVPSKVNLHPKGGDPSFLGRIRLIRVSSHDESSVTVVQEGAREGEWNAGEGEVDMSDADDE